MLVLSRKINQKIKIGKDITLTVVGMRCGHVKIGIDAPKEIPIVRDDANGIINDMAELAVDAKAVIKSIDNSIAQITDPSEHYSLRIVVETLRQTIKRIESNEE